MDVGSDPTGRPAPPPLSLGSPCTIPPAHAWSRRHPLGVVGEPAAGRIPSEPSVGGCSRLGASSRPQIGRWDRRQCHMPDFWVTWLEAQKSVECIRCDFLRSGCD